MSQNPLKKIALIGNPNCGKSSIFNLLTGLRQKVGNFPGVTVDKKVGVAKLNLEEEVEIIDFPGTYSIFPGSKDESIVVSTLIDRTDKNHPDAIVYIADVTKLEPQMLLLTQIIDLGIPVVLGLNMMDLAEKEGIQIDVGQLKKELGIEVVELSGRTGYNLSVLKSSMAQLLKNETVGNNKTFYHPGSNLKEIVAAVQNVHDEPNNYKALLLVHFGHQHKMLDASQQQAILAIRKTHQFNELRAQVEETMSRYDRFTPVLKKCLRDSKKGEASFSDKIDKVVTNKVAGPLLFFALMFLVFNAIFSWSELPMNWIEEGFGITGTYLKTILPESWATDLLTDGVLAGLGGVLVFIPQITILFFLISLLEEIGYMSRAVYMFDSIMQKFGLNGRSIVALVSSGACAVPAIMSTRTISNWKERLITIMVTPLISCSARIPVYTLLIAFVIPSYTVWKVFNSQALVFMALYLLGIISALLAAWTFKKILKSDEKSFLMIEMPPYRAPVVKNVLFTVKEKVMSFVLEAGKVIMLISIVLWFLASYGPGDSIVQAGKQAQIEAESKAMGAEQTANLVASKQLEVSYAGHFGKAIEPAIAPIGLNWKMGIALITSFAAREVFVGTMATIYSIGSAEEDEYKIRAKMESAIDPETGEAEYNRATSWSLLLFYVFAMQCMSTLAVVKRETKSWKWPIIQFTYMSAMAYISSFIAYQLLS